MRLKRSGAFVRFKSDKHAHLQMPTHNPICLIVFNARKRLLAHRLRRDGDALNKWKNERSRGLYGSRTVAGQTL